MPSGRPLGSKNKAMKFRNYKPKRWPPEFDLIVLASFYGENNEAIGKKFGYTATHISNILCAAQAEEIRQNLRKKIDEEINGSVSSRLAAVSNVALKRVEDFIGNDQLAKGSPFNFVDRAFRALQLTGMSQEGNKGAKIDVNFNSNTQINNIGNDVLNRIGTALEKSNEAARLHEGLDPLKEIKLDSDNVRTGNNKP